MPRYRYREWCGRVVIGWCCPPGTCAGMCSTSQGGEGAGCQVHPLRFWTKCRNPTMSRGAGGLLDAHPAIRRHSHRDIQCTRHRDWTNLQKNFFLQATGHQLQ